MWRELPARLRHDPQVRLGGLPSLRILLLRIVIRHRARNDYIFAVLPVHRCRYLVFGSELERINDAQHLVEVAPGGHWIHQDELYLLVGPDDEDVAYRLIVSRSAL